MAANEEKQDPTPMRIVVLKDAAYLVEGNVPLVVKTQVVSEYGEPLTWQKTGEIVITRKKYILCRCGHSGKKPFCDASHRKAGFDGTESADADTFAERAVEIRGGTRITVMKDPALCMNSGFCGFYNAGLEDIVNATSDTRMRSLVIAMVERCPAGDLNYRLQPAGPDIEPDLPRQFAVTTVITSAGPIAGPLWVTGNIPVERSDGVPFETRNRVTLCCCGLWGSKPLCDDTHRMLPTPPHEP